MLISTILTLVFIVIATTTSTKACLVNSTDKYNLPSNSNNN